MMTSEAYQMASAFRRRRQTRPSDPENRYLWRFRPQRLDAEIVRDSMLAVGGDINLAMGGEPIFPYHAEGHSRRPVSRQVGNTPDGPAAWRRSVYVYQRGSLPYPMFDMFDLPDMNVTAGARNVSTVPTQALTLLNNAFVLSQAAAVCGAGEAARRPTRVHRSSWRIGSRSRGRRPSAEAAIGVNLIAKQSLVAFAHVLLNLNEFLYVR